MQRSFPSKKTILTEKEPILTERKQIFSTQEYRAGHKLLLLGKVRSTGVELS